MNIKCLCLCFTKLKLSIAPVQSLVSKWNTSDRFVLHTNTSPVEPVVDKNVTFWCAV